MGNGSEQPNILLILTDQHMLSAVGCYGDTVCQTPHIDRLAREGLRFETAYTVSPMCSPARGTIMTGLYPHAHGICANVHDLGASVHELSDRPELLSRRLESVGYRLGYTGKWHLGSDVETIFGARNHPSLPKDVGFEGHSIPGYGAGAGYQTSEYLHYLQKFRSEIRFKRLDKRPFALIPCGIVDGLVEATVPHFLADHTIGLLDEFSSESEQPFFVWHNFWGPHAPCYSTSEMYEQYRDVQIPEWPSFRWPASEINGPHQVKLHPLAEVATWEDWALAIRYYYAYVSLIDQQVGRIVNHLDQKGLRDNTVIIFTADHGKSLGTHGGLTDKGYCHFEETQRIPLIVSAPEKYLRDGLPPGSVVENWVSLVDLYPTILDFAGASDLAGEVHGRSILRFLPGESTERTDRVFVEFFGLNSLTTTMITCRNGHLKYGWNCSNRDELYDLRNDPHELHNLVSSQRYKGDLKRMREIMFEWMEAHDFPLSGRMMFRQSRLGKYFWFGDNLPPAGQETKKTDPIV